MDKIPISVCFCEIPESKMLELVRKRYVEKIPTQKLMGQLKNEQDRQYLSTIALLDVNEKDVLDCIEAKDPKILRHLFSCRQRALMILNQEGVTIDY
jgi:hypothetical protein